MSDKQTVSMQLPFPAMQWWGVAVGNGPTIACGRPGGMALHGLHGDPTRTAFRCFHHWP